MIANPFSKEEGFFLFQHFSFKLHDLRFLLIMVPFSIPFFFFDFRNMTFVTPLMLFRIIKNKYICGIKFKL